MEFSVLPSCVQMFNILWSDNLKEQPTQCNKLSTPLHKTVKLARQEGVWRHDSRHHHIQISAQNTSGLGEAAPTVRELVARSWQNLDTDSCPANLQPPLRLSTLQMWIALAKENSEPRQGLDLLWIKTVGVRIRSVVLTPTGVPMSWLAINWPREELQCIDWHLADPQRSSNVLTGT
jgi:hypothetical protein